LKQDRQWWACKHIFGGKVAAKGVLGCLGAVCGRGGYLLHLGYWGVSGALNLVRLRNVLDATIAYGVWVMACINDVCAVWWDDVSWTEAREYTCGTGALESLERAIKPQG
jgi:hypothetical protein